MQLQFPHLRWPLMSQELFVDDHYGKRAALLDITHPIHQLSHNLRPDGLDFDWRPVFCKCDPSDPLRDVLLAMCGDLPSSEQTGIDYRSLLAGQLGATSLEVFVDHPPPLAVADYYSLSFLTTYGLVRRRTTNFSNPAVYVGDCRSFADLVNFWNLRASDRSICFYDPGHSGRLSGIWDGFWKPLAAAPDRRRPWQCPAEVRSVAAWCRNAGGISALPPCELRLSERLLETEFIRGVFLEPPVAHLESQSALGVLDTTRALPSVTFQIPQKQFLEDPTRSDQHLAISIHPVGDLPEESGRTFWSPYLPTLNRYYGKECSLHNPWGVRAEPDGLAIIVPIHTDTVTLFALPRRELMAKVFETFGITATPSEAGLVTHRLIRQMGGLPWCKIFVIAGIRELIQGRDPGQSFGVKCADRIIGQANFGHYNNRFRGTGRNCTLTPKDAFLLLADRGVFQAGLEPKCPACALKFWLPIDAAKTRARCEFCGHDFDLTPQLRDCEWRYRRSGLFGRRDDQAGGIPVALTLRQLCRSSGFRMVYDTSLNLQGQSGCIPDCETDFAVLEGECDGRPSLAIGECKTKGEIKQADVDNLLAVARVFEGSPIRVFVVFAKLAQFGPSEIARLKDAKEMRHSDIILFSDKELEADLTYEWTRDICGEVLSSSGFDDLVRGTKRLYFDGSES